MKERNGMGNRKERESSRGKLRLTVMCGLVEFTNKSTSIAAKQPTRYGSD
jgi:hypothetical protein